MNNLFTKRLKTRLFTFCLIGLILFSLIGCASLCEREQTQNYCQSEAVGVRPYEENKTIEQRIINQPIKNQTVEQQTINQIVDNRANNETNTQTNLKNQFQIVDENLREATFKVAYLEQEDACTKEACEVFFEKLEDYVPYKTVRDEVFALVNRECDFAVIPMENAINGAEIDSLDELVSAKNVCVVGEVELPIRNKTRFYVLARGLEASLAFEDGNFCEIAQIIGNTKDYDTNFVSDTSGTQDNAGLDSSNDGLGEKLSNKGSADNGRIRLSFIACGSADGLPELMSRIENAGVRLVSIHDRPEKTTLGRYVYLIECGLDNVSQRFTYNDYEELLSNLLFEFRFLGIFVAK